MNEKDTIKLMDKLTKLIQLEKLDEMKEIVDLQSLDYENYADIFVEACAKGATPIVQYLYALKNPGDYAIQDGFRCCLDTGNLNTVQYLIHGVKIYDNAAIKDDIKAHLKTLQEWNKSFYNQVKALS